LIGGLAVRRACYGVLKYIMDEAKGCEIIVSGKLRAQRAKAMKFRDGYMIHSGDAAQHYVDKAIRHIKMKQGMLGISVAIMLPYDANGQNGGTTCKQPDVITIHEPKTYKKHVKVAPVAAEPVVDEAPLEQPAEELA